MQKIADLEVINHPEMKNFMKEKKIKRGCWCCFKHNCYLKQQLSRKYNLKKRLAEGCTGKILRFKNLVEKTNVSETTAEQNTTAITAAKPFDDNSVEEMQRIVDIAEDEEEFCEVGFEQFRAGISPQSTFTEDMIPDTQIFWSET